MNRETIILQLMQTAGIGARTLSRLLRVLSSEQRSLEDLFGEESAELAHRCGLPGDFSDRVGTDFAEAERLNDELDACCIQVVRQGSAEYPSRLIGTLGDAS
ncbi:MAG: hypothetical protein KAW61_06425, partial [candidate division Zixibacteria bacterium]|nr:hypothetical protein [candidate division Zixibacteria bacterium]